MGGVGPTAFHYPGLWGSELVVTIAYDCHSGGIGELGERFSGTQTTQRRADWRDVCGQWLGGPADCRSHLPVI